MAKEVKQVTLTENAFNKHLVFCTKYFDDGSHIEFTLSKRGALKWAKNYQEEGVRVMLYFS